MTRKSAVLETFVPEPQAPNGTTPGYRAKVRTRRIVADQEHWPAALEELWPMWPDEGAEPFWADIRANLTFDDLDRIPVSSGVTFAEQWAVIADWVVAWNAMAWDQLSKSWQPVPPPAEMGPDAFKTQPHAVTSFIVLCLKNHGLGTDLPKGRKPTDATDGG